MKKFLNLMLISGFLFMTVAANAQFRKIPGAVTDAFKVKYPSAQTVSWEDKVSAFQASFVIDGETYSARYTSKAEWLGSQKKIQEDKLPSAVKDGLAKSKYADWEVKTVTAHYLPDGKMEYAIGVYKKGLNKKNLLFSSEGQLLKDNYTLWF
ncbi:MAG TPA: PepSY-like domain-containing protein [Puia sp.]